MLYSLYRKPSEIPARISLSIGRNGSLFVKISSFGDADGNMDS